MYPTVARLRASGCLFFITILLVGLLFGPIMIAGAIPGGFAVQASTASHPDSYLNGTVTKEVLYGKSIWAYVVEDTEKSLADFEVAGNLTIALDKIKFSDAFLNQSVVGDVSNDNATSTVFQALIDADEISYIIGETHNSSGENYVANLTDLLDFALTNDYYLVICMRIHSSDTTNPRAYVAFKLIDSGGSDHYLVIKHTEEASSVSAVDWDGDGFTDDIMVKEQASSITSYAVVQKKLSHMLGNASISVDILKATRIIYGVEGTNNVSIADNYAKAIFRYALFNPSQVKINGEVLEGTSLESNKKTVTINRAWDKVADVQIKFKNLPDSERSLQPDDLEIVYEWVFQITDKLTWSSVKLWHKSKVLGANYTKFEYEGVDKLTLLEDVKADEVITVDSSVSAGQSHILKAEIVYTDEDYDALTVGPSIFVWWEIPAAIQAAFWGVIGFLGSLLGIGTGYALKQKRKLRKVR